MAKKIKTKYDRVSTLLASDLVLEDGRLSAKSTVRIDGRFTGEIDLKGSLVIGKNGYVQGNINCENVLVAGNIQGNVHSFDQVHIASSGTINGDIACSRIIIDEGAVFTGKCTTRTDDKKDKLKADYKPDFESDLKADDTP